MGVAQHRFAGDVGAVIKWEVYPPKYMAMYHQTALI
jgi:hypothetical protein